VKAVSLDRFAQFLQEGGVAELGLAAHGADLFLACGCALGDDAAVAAFDAGPLRQVTGAIARLTRNPALRDEALQRTRVKLLVGQPPLIASYSGAGPLAAWVRVAAVRIALDLRERAGEQIEPDVMDRLGMGEMLQDSRLAGEQFRSRLAAALEHALGALAADDRVLLRMHFVDDLGVDDLGRFLQVHRATAARRLVAIRHRVLDETKRQMGVEFGTSSSEFRSLWRAFGDEIRVSVSRLLRQGERL
jgi:RNA polymerase sigma-70 factor (ECF subfamily)